ncbi:Beta-barrel assembly machine subunit BamB [Pseudomonas pohangensis]|uniref:Outer membrane protein assembly factor BamB n=2 Tax=Pseudomonas pohangensis TaxID=364197 RepID=A0A1H2GLE6_9PSED|nr:Beta-barrel assembly machine subunit BamB [Pseudomonas pohangensis]
MRWKTLAVLTLASVVVGCSSSKEQELEPAPLPDFTEKASLQQEWSRSVGDGQGEFYNKLIPAIDGNRIFASDLNGEVMAIDRLTGDKIWEKDLHHQVTGAISVNGNLLFVGTLKGKVVALDANTGELVWSAKVPSEVLAPPVSNGNVVVVQTQDDRVIGLDADTGKRLWISDNTPAVLTLRGTSAPLVTGTLAIAALSTGKVIALDVQNGSPVWQQKVTVPKGRSELERIVDIDGGLLLDGGILYVVTYQGRMAGLDVDSGQLVWERDSSSYVGLGEDFSNLYVSLASGVVEGIDKNSSSALWSNDQLLRRQLTAPAVISNYVAVGDFEGYVHLLSQADGQYVGREKVDSDGLRVRPLVVDNWIYVFANGGDLVAYTIK